MAKMFPNVEKTRVVFASSAEEAFYLQCTKEFSDAWRVFYSVTLSGLEHEEGLRDNEADFVLYHPRYGVVVVEVKGGRISFDAEKGQYFSVNRHGESHPIKNPFQQALVWKSRFLRLLRRQGIKVPVTHAACFPSVSEADFPMSAGIEPAIIIGREKLADLGKAVQDMVRKCHPQKFLQFTDVGDEVEKLLAGANFATRLYIRDYIDRHESQVRDVENLHETFVTPVSGSTRLGVEGEAGTGKTMLAVMMARKFRDQGRNVLVMTSNPFLNHFLAETLGEGVTVKTYGEVSGDFGIDLLKPPADYTGKEEDWVQYVGPERFGQAVAASPVRFDVIICDEAQDVQPFWWEPYERLLHNDGESRFYVFFDRSQGVFGSGGSNSFVPEEVLPIPAPYFPLVNNYRTTREIAAFARAFRTGQNVLQSHTARLGYVPELIVYKDEEDAKRKLGMLFRSLFGDEGMRPEEVTLLSARRPDADESVLRGLNAIEGIQLHDMTASRGKERKRLTEAGKVSVSTVQAFKGLETSVGVLLNVSEYNLPLDHPIMASLAYVACTRAKHMLYVMVREDDPKREVFQQALKSVKATGAIVIDNSGSEYEFCGTVIHYNPERLGWIEVDGGSAFDQGNIMFFPHDVKQASIATLRIGARVRFRPRSEGRATIAGDLRLVSGT